MNLRRVVAIWMAVTALGIAGGCSTSTFPYSFPGQPLGVDGTAELSPDWSVKTLPGAYPGHRLKLLERSSRVSPLRFRVIVIPGSGCTGFAPIADRYFAGLLHAKVQVLHKQATDIQAGPSPQHCPDGFIKSDSLTVWRDDAIAALRFLDQQEGLSTVNGESKQIPPTILVGISEGGELLPDIASAMPSVVGLVLLSSSGLDPRDAGAMQAARLGEQDAWDQLSRIAHSTDSDQTELEGRTLRYWRDLMQWQVAQSLMDSPLPVLQVWGDADLLLPPAAFEAFAALADNRRAQFCSWRLPGADHGLQGPAASDGLKLVWAQLEYWGRAGKMSCEGPGKTQNFCAFIAGNYSPPQTVLSSGSYKIMSDNQR